MAKKIPVLNSPWGRDFERPSDCERWIKQGHALLVDGALSFTQAFFESQRRLAVEFDPIGADDGQARRWTNRPSGRPTAAMQGINGELIERMIVRSAGGISAKQLLRTDYVGTGKGVTSNPDKLTRRTGHGRARSVVA